MAAVYVNGSGHLPAESQFKSVGLD